MSGRNIGHVEFLVDFDGDDLPRQARRIGNEAGDELGKGVNKGADEHLSKFGTRLRKEMHDAGRDGGLQFSDAFDQSINRNLDDTVREMAGIFSKENGFEDYANSFDSVSEASDDLDRKLTRLHDTGRITDDQFLDMIDTQSEFTLRAIRASDEVERQGKALSDLGDEIGRLRNGRLIETADGLHGLNEELSQLKNVRLIETAQGIEGVAGNIRQLSLAKGEIQDINEAFSDRTAVQKYAEMWRTDLPGAFERFDRKLRSTRDAFPELGDEIDRVRVHGAGLFKELGLGRTRFERISDSVTRFAFGGDLARKTFGRLGEAIRNVNIGLPALSHGLKQGVFYTGLFTALAPGIAVLSSVSGSGLAALATNFGALGIGIAAVIPGFKDMLGDLDKVEPRARGAAAAIQAFGDPLGEMQDIIQGNMFAGLGDDIDALRTKTLPRLTAGMGKTASTVNGIFDDLLDRLASPRTLGRLDHIFEELQPNLKSLGGTVLNVGAAFSTIFEGGLESGKGFARFLEGITGDFNAFLNAPEGQDALAEFFEHLDTIMPRVGSLIGAAGKAVSSLVTDQAIENMASFLDTMTVALPQVVGGLGGLIDTVDPLGLAASALQKIGDGFASRADDIAAFGTAANDFAKGGGSLLGGLLGTVADAVLRIAPGVLEDLAGAFDSLNSKGNQTAFKDGIEGVADAVSAAADAVGDLIEILSDSGTISGTLGKIGEAGDVAAAGLNAFDGALDLVSGDLDGFKKKMKDFDLSKITKGLKDLNPLNAGGNLLGGIFDKLWGGGSTIAPGEGKKAGEGYVSGVVSGVNGQGPQITTAGMTAKTNLTTPFDAAPQEVGAKVGGIPGVIGGIMSLVTGQPGADNTANPFLATPGKVGANAAGIPGVIAGILGLVTGQPGADNVVDPFAPTSTRIQAYVNGVPQTVNSGLAGVTGQPAADRVVDPFNGTPGRVGGKVSGVSGAVSGQMGGIDDFGAAARIVSAFSGVPGSVRSALAGLGGIVSGALSVAKTTLSVGIAALKVPFTATGGAFDSPQLRVIGEAGPEAVVPLNRPLSRVDPAVRDLSAIAQGKAAPASGSGSGVYVADGAIRVTVPNSDPRLVAAATVDRIVREAMK